MTCTMLEDACLGFEKAVTEFIAALRAAREERGEGVPLSRETWESQDRSPIVDAVPCHGCVHMYMAGARGLADLTRKHGEAIMTALGLVGDPYLLKVGTTTIPLESRLFQIGQDQYGAIVRESGKTVREPGFSRWIAHTIIPPRRQIHSPRITVLPRSIAVALPPNMTRRQFDGRLHSALAVRAVDQLSEAVLPRRYVGYNLGTTRLSRAREFYAISPHRHSDCELLLSAIEGIIA